VKGPDYAREGFHCLAVYLVVEDARKLIPFLHAVFGARERVKFLRPDGGVMHSEFEIGDSAIELADGGPNTPPRPMVLHIYVPDADATFQEALRHGASPLYEPVDRIWSDRDGGVKDPSGNVWAIATRRDGGGYLPEGRRTITPYVSLEGAAGFLGFVETVFDGQREYLGRNDTGGVLYARVRIGDSVLEMGDVAPGAAPMPGSLNVWTPDSDECYRRAIAAGAASLYAPTDKPYGDREAGVRDPWGNCWFIATRRA